jgi:hypothetical protein
MLKTNKDLFRKMEKGGIKKHCGKHNYRNNIYNRAEKFGKKKGTKKMVGKEKYDEVEVKNILKGTIIKNS